MLWTLLCPHFLLPDVYPCVAACRLMATKDKISEFPSREAGVSQELEVGFGKRGLWKKGSFQQSPFLEILEKKEILEIFESPRTLKNKGESDHFQEILENLEILEFLEIPSVKRPFPTDHFLRPQRTKILTLQNLRKATPQESALGRTNLNFWIHIVRMFFAWLTGLILATFLEFLAFFLLLQGIPCFFSVFCTFFPKDFGGSPSKKNPCFFSSSRILPTQSGKKTGFPQTFLRLFQTTSDLSSGTKTPRFLKRERLRFSCVCVLKTLGFEKLRFRGTTVMFAIITFLIQKHFKTVTVMVILGKLIQMTFKTVIGNQWKWRGDCGRQDGNGNGNSSEFQDGNGNGNLGKINSQELALFRSLCNKRQLSRKNKFDKLSGMFPTLVFVAFWAQNFA